MQQYEVAFVVEGYVELDHDANIGVVECTGLTRDDNTVYYLQDGRAYYTVEADSPEEAYAKAETLFEADDIGALQITSSYLEHVSKGDQYWYEEDLEKRAIEHKKADTPATCYVFEEGNVVNSKDFPSVKEAESWMREEYAERLEEGVNEPLFQCSMQREAIILFSDGGFYLWRIVTG
ncbi:MAG: hypothetical protein Q4B26_19585 [Eubacteriales bacterium]|nr:hypothetical protein [Eubacteriales bacterium]